MKKLSFLVASAIASAIVCGFWSFVAGATGLSIWAGFAGCTTYFATGKRGIDAIIKSVSNNFAGVACGMSIMILGNIFPNKFSVLFALITIKHKKENKITYAKNLDFFIITLLNMNNTKNKILCQS